MAESVSSGGLLYLNASLSIAVGADFVRSNFPADN